MNQFVYLIYSALVGLIRLYKMVEFQVLLLFTPLLIKKGKDIAETIGVIFHCPGDNPNENNELTINSKCDQNQQECKELANLNCGNNYERPIHMKVTNNQYFVKTANLGSLGSGEAFMNCYIDCYNNQIEDITEFVKRLMESNTMNLYYNPWNRFLEWLELYAFNMQTRERAFEVGKAHYDIGNDLYELMLDPWMQYTCGYWKNADNLNDAQLHKMELIAKKLDLKPGMRILDIGCGWGLLCKYLAENYEVKCVGVTISKEGVAYGKKICKSLPVELSLQDYRDVNEKFDRIVSIGMFEHVGHWNYREFFKIAEKCLVDDGIFLLHTIGRNHHVYPQRTDPWLVKYIFPNAMLPSPIDISTSTKDLFIIEDWHNFSLDYAKTLFCWRENFMRTWPKIQNKYGESFYRLWILYLTFCRASFLSRRSQLWQVVLSKDGLKGEYRAGR